MFPVIFNIVADMLDILVARIKEDGQAVGLIAHSVEGGGSGLLLWKTQSSSRRHEKKTIKSLITYF